ncbi:MAG: DUF1080 domain-containing protein [Gemmatimonadetes bacterium]|nr:DUF1080 domain-containing protein [Gemmatimonadota bacterium]
MRHSGRSMLVGAFVNMVGSARPVARIDYREGDFKFSLPPQWNDAEGENTVVGRLKGDSITGTISYANGQKQAFRGARAPSLVRTAPPAWELPTTLFNGRDLTGWKALGEGTNQWEVANGVLRNKAAGTDLVTERQFTDFKLHLEFRFPRGATAASTCAGVTRCRSKTHRGTRRRSTDSAPCTATSFLTSWPRSAPTSGSRTTSRSSDAA